MSAVGTICSPGRDHKIGPSLLKFLCIPATTDRSPQGIMHCKSGMMGKSDIDSTTISKYREHMLNTYKDGTHRSGPLMQISVVGTVHEEVVVNINCPP
jgi:hypothetical protein